MAVDQNLSRVAALNLPAILRLRHPMDQRPVYVLLEKASSNALTLVFDESGQPAEASSEEIMAHWDGRAFVLWKNFYNYSALITFNAPKESIIALKLHLRDIGYTDIGINAIFDRETQSIIKEIQARHGIPVDGFVGALTQIALYNETPHLAIPHLREPGRLQVGTTTDLPDGENRAEENP
jgi:general secretion pathway protein A